MNNNITIKALTFNINKQAHEVSIQDLPAETIDRLLQYGTRMLNDKINSEASKAAGEGRSYDKDEAANIWIQKAIDGKLGERTARASDPLTRIIKDLVVERIISLGITKADASKFAKNPAEGFRMYLELVLAAKHGCTVGELDQKDVDAAVERNWPKVSEKAAQIRDIQSSGDDIEI